MSFALSAVLATSILGLVGCVWWASVVRARPRRLARALALTVLAGVALRYSLAEGVETKGAVHETLAIAFCYAAMVLGMVAQYAYRQAETRDFRFDPAAFFMPIFASPIVFIPLLVVIGDVNTTGALAQPKLMVYLVAFQNGFFWRGVFARDMAHPAGRASLAAAELGAVVPSGIDR
jgi:hypothetical protein